LTVKPWYIVLLALSLGACNSPQAPKKETPNPDWVIPEAKMTEILVDVHIIEGARIGKKVLGDSLYAIDHYNFLWEKYGITEAQYDSSFDFYNKNAEKMDRMYEKVILELSKISSKQGAKASDLDEEKEE